MVHSKKRSAVYHPLTTHFDLKLRPVRVTQISGTTSTTPDRKAKQHHHHQAEMSIKGVSLEKS